MYYLGLWAIRCVWDGGSAGWGVVVNSHRSFFFLWILIFLFEKAEKQNNSIYPFSSHDVPSGTYIYRYGARNIMSLW